MPRMASKDWHRRGPRVFGYEPGWPWWAAVFVVVTGGLFYGSHQLDRHRRNLAYLHERAAFHAAEQGLDVALVFAVIEAESGWDWRAKSPAGAKGLMQVTAIALDDVRRLDGVGGLRSPISPRASLPCICSRISSNSRRT